MAVPAVLKQGAVIEQGGNGDACHDQQQEPLGGYQCRFFDGQQTPDKQGGYGSGHPQGHALEVGQ